MKLKSIRIENFRSFKDDTIDFDDYTSLVGPNGAGKSSVLTALNVFFRNNASSATNIHSLSEEDFHHANKRTPVKITLTFNELSIKAQSDLKHYYRQGELTVTAKAEWDEGSQSAEVKQYGARLVMTDFATFFEADASKAKVPKLNEIYSGLRVKYPDLPAPGTKAEMIESLRKYEEEHPSACELLDETCQFYGWSKGAGFLRKYIRWVYVPAVKDASTEQDEGNRTALGQLLEHTIRSKVSFDETLLALRSEIQTQYQYLLDNEQQVLSDLQGSLQRRLQSWATPAASVELKWHSDPKSVVVNEPNARLSIGEDGFIGEVARLGHGMQRAFIVSILQELAESDQEFGPRLLLGFEEPELYQHPSQAKHIADMLETLTAGEDGSAQIIVSTHSPYFISSKGFENVRAIRKSHSSHSSTSTRTTYAEIEKVLAEAMGEKPTSPSSLMARIEQIMQPSQKELYFSKVVILVEGLEDVAYLSTWLQLVGKWNEFRKHGCHFVITEGKTSLSRPLAIANQLSIPAFVVFDSDANATNNDDRKQHQRDNSCILRLCGVEDFVALPLETLWHNKCVMWNTSIREVISEEFGEEWGTAEIAAKKKTGFTNGVNRKNNLLIAATLEELAFRKKDSPSLSKLSDHIIDFSKSAIA